MQDPVRSGGVDRIHGSAVTTCHAVQPPVASLNQASRRRFIENAAETVEDRQCPVSIDREERSPSVVAASLRRTVEPTVARLDEARHGRACTERDAMDGGDAAAGIDHEDRAVPEIAAARRQPIDVPIARRKQIP